MNWRAFYVHYLCSFVYDQLYMDQNYKTVTTTTQMEQNYTTILQMAVVTMIELLTYTL